MAARAIHSSLARQQYIQRVCLGDLELQRRIERCLQAQVGTASLLEDFDGRNSEADTETIGLKTAELPSYTESPAHAALADSTQPANVAASEAPVSVGQLLASRYRIQATIGRGGMGWVLRARDEKLHRDVAVKLLTPALVSTPQAADRLRREAHAASTVAHAKVVRIESVEESSGIPFLVMEFVDGESLAHRLARQKWLSQGEILRIGCEVAEGLAVAHRRGLIHLDIKPANILLDKYTGEARISDFGLARIGEDYPPAADGQIDGTPQYMSPEQASGARVDARSDLFSLGVVIYEMCTGISPFRAETGIATLRRVRETSPPDILKVRPDLPPELAMIVARLLAKLPSDRVKSARAVMESLREMLTAFDRTRLPDIACSVLRP